MKLTRITLGLVSAYGLVDRQFSHMRLNTYLASGGPLLTVKVV